MDIQSTLLKDTNLSEPQVSLLLRIAEFIPFAESVVQHAVYMFTAYQEGGFLKIYPIKHGIACQSLSATIVPIWTQLLSEGQPIQGFQEDQNGKLAFIITYPIVDNGGKVIGGLVFKNPHIESVADENIIQQILLLTETTYMSMLMPQDILDNPKSLYEPLSYQDGVIIFDEGGTIMYGNESASRLVNLLGFDRRLVGSSIYGSSLKLSFVKKVLTERQGAISEEIYQDIVVRQTVIPVFFGRGLSRSFLFLKDMTRESKQQQALLVKNSVIKEIHHRVKNNLQTVAGLLRMEARRSDSNEVKKALQEGISRIESMALVHDIVSHYDEDYISIRSIYDELSRLLKNSMLLPKQQVQCDYIGDDIIISSHQASYVSLIINELISNSIEHGLGTQDGHITLSVQDNNQRILITLGDDGKGLPESFSLDASKRLGLQIIRNLVTHELQGTIQMGNHQSGGTIVTIDFEKGE